MRRKEDAVRYDMIWLKTKTAGDRNKYKEARRNARRSVALAQEKTRQEFVNELKSTAGKKNVYRVAKQIVVAVNCAMQFGFMPGKGTTDAIFTVRQMQEKYGCKGKKLYFAFVDLEKHMIEYPERSLDSRGAGRVLGQGGQNSAQSAERIFSFAHPGFQFAHPAIRNGCPPCPPYRGGFKGKGLVGY